MAFAVGSLSGSPVAHGGTQCWDSPHLTLLPTACRALGVLFTFPKKKKQKKKSYKHTRNPLDTFRQHSELKVKVAFIRHCFNHLFEEELNVFSLH